MLHMRDLYLRESLMKKHKKVVEQAIKAEMILTASVASEIRD